MYIDIDYYVQKYIYIYNVRWKPNESNKTL